MGFLIRRDARFPLDTLRTLLVARNGALFSHDLRRARLFRLAGGVSEFARRGLQHDDRVFSEDVLLPERCVGSRNALKLVRALNRANFGGGPQEVAQVAARHRDVRWTVECGGGLNPDGDVPRRAVCILLDWERERAQMTSAASLLQRLLPNDSPLGRWTVFASLRPEEVKRTRVTESVSPSSSSSSSPSSVSSSPHGSQSDDEATRRSDIVVAAARTEETRSTGGKRRRRHWDDSWGADGRGGNGGNGDRIEERGERAGKGKKKAKRDPSRPGRGPRTGRPPTVRCGRLSRFSNADADDRGRRSALESEWARGGEGGSRAYAAATAAATEARERRERVWALVTEAGPVLAYQPATARRCRLADSLRAFWRRGPTALWGHWGYAAPGYGLDGEEWPLCAHSADPDE